MNRSDRTSITSIALSLRATRIAKHSWLNSSSTLNPYLRPSWVRDKVVGPDMIAVLRAQPNARSVGEPEPAALGLLMGNLQPLALPDTLDPLVVDYPTRIAQKVTDVAFSENAGTSGGKYSLNFRHAQCLQPPPANGWAPLSCMR